MNFKKVWNYMYISLNFTTKEKLPRLGVEVWSSANCQSKFPDRYEQTYSPRQKKNLFGQEKKSLEFDKIQII